MKSINSVAIPFEVGQVSTLLMSYYVEIEILHVAIPFEVGQVSTWKLMLVEKDC